MSRTNIHSLPPSSPLLQPPATKPVVAAGTQGSSTGTVPAALKINGQVHSQTLPPIPLRYRALARLRAGIGWAVGLLHSIPLLGRLLRPLIRRWEGEGTAYSGGAGQPHLPYPWPNEALQTLVDDPETRRAYAALRGLSGDDQRASLVQLMRARTANSSATSADDKEDDAASSSSWQSARSSASVADSHEPMPLEQSSGDETDGLQSPRSSRSSRSSQARARKLDHHLVDGTGRVENQLQFRVNAGHLSIDQRWGHVEAMADGDSTRFRVVNGSTLSSISIKGSKVVGHAAKQQYNANLGIGSVDGSLRWVRSARTDNAKRLEELLLMGAAARPEADDGVPYRAAIVSAMDLSPKKDWLLRLQNLLWGGGEAETNFLQHQEAAVQDLFAQADFIYREVDGRIVQLSRPLLFNLPISAQSNTPMNILLARERDLPAAQATFSLLARTWATSTTLSPAAQQLGHRMQACGQDQAAQKTLLSDMRQHDRTGEATDLQQLVQALPAPERLALSALRLFLYGKDLHGRAHMESTGPAMAFLLQQHLFLACGLIPHVQCKSGLDRTGTLVALLAAFFTSRATGQPVDPGKVEWADSGAETTFASRFALAIKHLGMPAIQEVRIKSKPKWGNQPIMQRYQELAAAEKQPTAGKIVAVEQKVAPRDPDKAQQTAAWLANLD